MAKTVNYTDEDFSHALPDRFLDFRDERSGQVLFYNYDSPYMDAPVYDSDRVTAVFGPQFTTALFAGPSSNSLAQVASARFIRAGYYFNGIQAISTVSPGSTAWIQVQVWNTQSGASFAQAQASGLPDSWWQSPVFSVATGSPFGVPTPPGALTGLGNGPVFLNGATVPEPSTIALGITGALLGVRAAARRPVFQPPAV